MTGTVISILGKHETFCFIKDSTGTDYFAHRSDFVDPTKMQVGNLVEFRVKLATTGKRPAATDVVLIQKTAA